MEEETIDLFEQYETLPKEVQDVLEQFCDGENSYEQCRALIDALEPLGYTCEYGLDGQPYSLRKMTAKDKLSNLYSEVKAEGNCKDYVHEMCVQLTLFGIESNTLTKQMVHLVLNPIH